MLSGVGGKSVEEAKEFLTHWEVMEFWIPYEEKHGPLNQTARMELGFAQLCRLVNNSLGGHAKLEDYLPYQQEREATPADLMNLLITGKG